jgi:hypothetical protein
MLFLKFESLKLSSIVSKTLELEKLIKTGKYLNVHSLYICQYVFKVKRCNLRRILPAFHKIFCVCGSCYCYKLEVVLYLVADTHIQYGSGKYSGNKEYYEFLLLGLWR